MKRYNFITFCIAIVCFSAHPFFVKPLHAQSGAHKIILEIQKGLKEIKVKSGGRYVSVSPMPELQYPRVFVPLEPLYEQLGFSVSGAPQTIVQKTKPEKKKIVPVKQKETETTKKPQMPVVQPATQPEKTPDKTAEALQNITLPKTTLPSPVKTKASQLLIGYSFFSLQHIKHSNMGIKMELFYKLPALHNAYVTLSYAMHRWKSDSAGAVMPHLAVF